MFRRTRALLSALLVSIPLLMTSVQPAAAAGGNFWLFNGDGSTGAYRGFTMSSGWSGALSGKTFTYDCGGTCTTMDNKIESVTFDCGTMDEDDYLKIFDGPQLTGSWTIVPFSVSACSNGVQKYEIPSTWDNRASSVQFVE